MERKIFVYENFSSLEPKKLGVLYVDTLRGIEHYSFEYDQDWLKQSKFSFLRVNNLCARDCFIYGLI